MDDFVKATGRTRYATQIITTGRWFRKYDHVVIVLQIEEFYHTVVPGEIDRGGHADADRIYQGYRWRDATLEDLATMGSRHYEPTVEDVRRHTRPYASPAAPHLGPRPSVPPAQQADDWPGFLRGYPDMAPPGFKETPPRGSGGGTSPTSAGAQPPATSGPSY